MRSDSKKRYPSSVDVARLAGVSQSSVSRSFTEFGRVSEDTRLKVLEAARQLGYRPNLLPRMIMTHQSHFVAIVISSVENPFYSTVLGTFAARLQAAGKQVLLVHVDKGHFLDPVISRLAGFRVGAVVSALAITTPESAAQLAEFKIPVVAFNTHNSNDWVHSVSVDNIGAAANLAELLVRRGGQRFAFIGGGPNSSASVDRLNGFREALKQRGVSELGHREMEFSYDGGYRGALELFSDPSHRPDAVLCANDLIAIGASDALRKQLGLAIPQDVLIAGFDDIPAASWAAYDLTTVVQDSQAMVTASLSILDRALEAGGPLSGMDIVVPTPIVERSSTRRRV